MVGAHLYDGDLRIGSDAQKAQRNADVVVQIALGGGNLEFALQYGRNEVLRGGLAVCAGEAYNGQLALPDVRTMPYCKVPQSSKRVRHPDKTAILRKGGIFIDHRPGGSGLQRLCRKGISVKILSPQGKEHLPALNCTAVGRNLVSAAAVFFV